MLKLFQKFSLCLDENEETKRRKIDEFLNTDIGKAAFWDFGNGK